MLVSTSKKIAPLLFFALFVFGGVSTVFPQTVYAEDPPAKADPSGGAKDAAIEEGKRIDTKPKYSSADFHCEATLTGVANCFAFGAYYLMTLADTATSWAGIILNYAIMEFVVGMGVLVGNISGVTYAWSMVRDVANLALVFSAIYIGVSLILGTGRYADKKRLIYVMVAALVVNFSMPIAKLIIDVSNLLTTQLLVLVLKEGKSITEKAGGDAPEGPACATSPLTGAELSLGDTGNKKCLDNGVSAIFAERLRLASMFNPDIMSAGPGDVIAWRIVVASIVAILLFLAAAFVFLAAAFMLLTRFFYLIFLIVVSPLALVSSVTGIEKKWGSDWWNKLLNQAFFAPALMFCWWATLRVSSGLDERFMLSGSLLAGALSVNDRQTTIVAMGIATYIILTYLGILGSLLAAKYMGAHGAVTAERWFQKGRGYAKSAGVGTLRFGRDQTYGRVMRGVGGATERFFERGQEMERDAQGNLTGRYKYRRAAQLARFGTWTGLDAKIAGGIKSQGAGIAMRDKRYQERRGNLQTQNAKTNDMNYAARFAQGDTTLTDFEKNRAQVAIGKFGEAEIRELMGKIKSDAGQTSLLSGMSEGAKEVSAEQVEKEQWGRIAEHLSRDQMKIFDKPEMRSAGTALRQARVDMVSKTLDQISAPPPQGGRTADEQKALKDLTQKMLKSFEKLSSEERNGLLSQGPTINKLATHLNASHMEELEKDASMKKALEDIRDKRRSAHMDLVTSGTPESLKAATALYRNMTDAEKKALGGQAKALLDEMSVASGAEKVAKGSLLKRHIKLLDSKGVLGIDNDTLMNPEIMGSLEGFHLEAFDKNEDSLTREQRIAIREHVQKNGTDSGKKFFQNTKSHLWS